MEHPKLLAYCTPKNSGYKLENNTVFFFLGLSQSLLMIVIWLLTKNQKQNTKICCCSLNSKKYLFDLQQRQQIILVFGFWFSVISQITIINND